MSQDQVNEISSTTNISLFFPESESQSNSINLNAPLQCDQVSSSDPLFEFSLMSRSSPLRFSPSMFIFENDDDDESLNHFMRAIAEIHAENEREPTPQQQNDAVYGNDSDSDVIVWSGDEEERVHDNDPRSVNL